jgi:diguanylate cyclase (GGDEF)-like protein
MLTTRTIFERRDPLQQRAWLWKAAGVTTSVVLAIAWMAYQSVIDRQAAQLSAEHYVSDLSDQVLRRLEDRVTFTRLLGATVRHDLPMAPGAERERALVAIQKMFKGSLPHHEIAIFAADGAMLVSSDERLFRGLLASTRSLIEELTKDSSRAGAMRFIPQTVDAGQLLLAHGLRDVAGRLSAVLMVSEPTDSLDSLFKISRLGPGGNITLLDAENRLIKREPVSLATPVGQQIARFDDSRPGGTPGVYRLVSAIDGEQRLMAMRTLQLKTLGTALTLQVGITEDAYLADWRRSTAINIGVCVLLLSGWWLDFSTRRRAALEQARLLQSAGALQATLEGLPMALAVVGVDDDRIVYGNPTLVEDFGAVAAQGEPVSRLFADESAWRLFAERRGDVMELVCRSGRAFMRVNRRNIGSMGVFDQDCWLLTFVDVTESHLREQRLRMEATTDTLTGLANRRHFDAVARDAVAIARARQQPLAVVTLDIDHFKRVNDQYGHDAGDIVLTLAAKLFQAALRSQDLASRQGGEEFAALLPDTRLDEAFKVAERIRHAIASTPVMLGSGEVLSVTASFGVSVLHDRDQDLQPALKRADEALYRAKETGRNRVVSAEG